MVDGFDEERGVALDLKEATAIVGRCGDEVSAGAGSAGGDRHSAIVTARTSAAEAAFLWTVSARLKPCP